MERLHGIWLRRMGNLYSACVAEWSNKYWKLSLLRCLLADIVGHQGTATAGPAAYHRILVGVMKIGKNAHRARIELKAFAFRTSLLTIKPPSLPDVNTPNIDYGLYGYTG